MNNIFYKSYEVNFDSNLDENYKNALNLIERKLEYPELIELLKSDKIADRHFAALNINEVKSSEDASLLVSNLIGQDGKIREAVSYKIVELCETEIYRQYFIGEKIFKVLFQGLMDINGNVCRNIVQLLYFEGFKQFVSSNILECIKNILQQIENLSDEEKKYVVSKRNFQLYWALEALYFVHNDVNQILLVELLTQCAHFDDYTIREKVSRIVSLEQKLVENEILSNLKNDENYYVRRYFE